MNTIKRLVEDLKYRQTFLNKRHSAYNLATADPKFLIEFTYPHVLTGLERKATLTDIIATMGGRLQQKLKLPRNSIEAVQFGWYILISYFEEGILSYFCKRMKGKGKHTTYQLKVTNWEAIQSLIEEVDDEVADMFPKLKPLEPWVGELLHKETGKPLIRNAHRDAEKAIKTTDLSYLTDTLNKLNNTGWRINKYILTVYKHCLTSVDNPFKFAKEVDKTKRTSLLMETEAVFRLATKHQDNVFYHLYNCDFRGRIYPNTAYLHEQSSDNAKGLLLLDEPTMLGKDGFYWLCVHTANMWGNDKVSLDDRARFAEENAKEYIAYAENPLTNIGWMKADKPFCFLACCLEIKMIKEWREDGLSMEDFPSSLPIYIDGSNNGVQHLTAMSKDEQVAPLVNLVPQKLPGDVYMFIADHAMTAVAKSLSNLDKDTIDSFEPYFEKIIALKRDCERWPEGTEKYKLAVSALKEFKNHNYDFSKKIWPVFWSAITDRKIWRKTVKRPVMTLGYGGTQFGMGEQIKDDTRSINEYLRDKEDIWAYKLGHLVYETCYKELKGPAKLLQMFVKLAERQNEKEVPISYSAPVTNFPFVHKYRKAKSERAVLKYGDDKVRIRLQVWEQSTLDHNKQKSGAAPNIVHSLDAVHLTMTVHDAHYPVTVVHDSFGCTAGNMEHMFKHVRQKFVELYKLQPLEHVLSQMDSLDLIPAKGTLNVQEVIQSDFAFA